MAKVRKRNRKPKGSSKAGRPKKEGARFPSGGLRPAGPNNRVVALRKAMLGDDKLDITKASDPMDLAHARKWISDAQHRAVRTLQRLYHQARLGAPRMGNGGLHEVQPSLQIDARSFSIMPDAEIEALWDQVFCDEGESNPDERTERALALWGVIMGGLGKAEQAEVFSVCIAGSWPQWMVYEASGKAVPATWELRRSRLFAGLAYARQIMREERFGIEKPPRERRAFPPRDRRARMVEERIVYVNEEGDPVAMVSTETGKHFELVRMVRRTG